MSKNNIKLKDLILDDKNFNVGSEYGNQLIEKSFRTFGAGRSILIDRKNRIIAGNKSVENAFLIGLEDVQIVESDGTKIIAVKRTDIDLDSPVGREMALADNATAKANIVFDAELIEAELGEAVCEEWGVYHGSDGSGDDNDEDIEDEKDKYTENKYPLSIVLTKPEMMLFDRVKKSIGLIEDTTAFLKLIKEYKL